MDRDEALNAIAKMQHNGEEIESCDGLKVMVDIDLWNDACEALEYLVGDCEDAEQG